MRKNVFLILQFILIFNLLWSYSSRAQAIRLQKNNWFEVLNASDLTISGEAGSDLNPTLETSTNYNQLDIRNLGSTINWKVTVSKRDINWPSAFMPFVIRNSNGTSCGGCTGINTGTSVSGYIQITNLEQDFIYGTGRVDDIDLQFKIEGITLAVSAQNYQTEIVFTLYGD